MTLAVVPAENTVEELRRLREICTTLEAQRDAALKTIDTQANIKTIVATLETVVRDVDTARTTLRELGGELQSVHESLARLRRLKLALLLYRGLRWWPVVAMVLGQALGWYVLGWGLKTGWGAGQ